jgi:hypothetical protein
VPQAHLWEQCADALCGVLETISDIGYRNPTPAQAHTFCDHAISYCRAAEALEIPDKPKAHMFLEMGARTLLLETMFN